MKRILNITNGDCAVEIMRKAKIPGDLLPWRDILHDGPVPENLSLDQLSKIRIQFIVDRGWGTLEDVTNQFVERDNKLKSFEKYDKVILWFEHDLYDQLQLLQILDWLNQNRPTETTLSMICIDNYLGMLSPTEMTALFKYEEPITENHLELASTAWLAFCASTPEKLCDLLKTNTTVLPFLEGAIIRLLEEYPSYRNGLSRTAQEVLKIILRGEKLPAEVFRHYQETEECQFLGDSSFLLILRQLLETSQPLLKLAKGKELNSLSNANQELTITSTGDEVLAGVINWLDISKPDYWIGGVHMTLDNLWCWDAATGLISQRK